MFELSYVKTLINVEVVDIKSFRKSLFFLEDSAYSFPTVRNT